MVAVKEVCCGHGDFGNCCPMQWPMSEMCVLDNFSRQLPSQIHIQCCFSVNLEVDTKFFFCFLLSDGVPTSTQSGPGLFSFSNIYVDPTHFHRWNSDPCSYKLIIFYFSILAWLRWEISQVADEARYIYLDLHGAP